MYYNSRVCTLYLLIDNSRQLPVTPFSSVLKISAVGRHSNYRPDAGRWWADATTKRTKVGLGLQIYIIITHLAMYIPFRDFVHIFMLHDLR